MKAYFRRAGLAVAGATWILIVGAGFYAVSAHGATPGRSATAPQNLSSSLRPSSGRSTLVMVAHPHCPCTRASLHELESILGSVEREHAANTDVVILFAGRATNRDRVADDLHSIATRIAGARVIDDVDGAEAKRLGAHTSGTVIFYDETGAMRFSGGITSSRGHEGRSEGGDSVHALLLRSPKTTTTAAAATPVFGCGLAASSSSSPGAAAR